MIGRTLGRFRIVAPLGTGGMASVWRAHDELLDRDLALKILSESLAESEDARRRFRREALTAAALDHPAIAAVYDSGETDGFTWIAMTLIDGETLAERLARSLLPVARMITIAAAVADALGYAHGRGVVHRDVTARNIMLGRDGRVFVLDFGLALAQGASRISSSGTTVGTAPYMAPEVIVGGTASPRSDLYGLGVVLYEALTGALPFAASARPAAAVFSVLNDPVRPPREWRPEIPAALDAIVMRCLARDPGRRFADADELATALRAVENGLGRATPPSVAAPAARNPSAETEGDSARERHSTIAERLAAGAPVYLAIPPFLTSDVEPASERELTGLGRGMATAAAAALSQLQRIHVVATDAAPPERTPESLLACARAMGAQLLVLGELRRAGTRLRATFALHDPEAGLQIAGDSLEGSLLDPFELEERVLASLERALGRAGGRFDSEATTRVRPRDPAATERWRQAVRYMERHDDEASVDAAIAILERLIESEGESAKYEAALARTYLFKYNLSRRRTWEARAAVAAARAAELGADAPETLIALGDLHRVAGRFEEAEREFGLALAQRPDDYEARLGRGRTLDGLGRAADAEAEYLRAIEGRPNDWRGHSLLGLLRFSHGRYEEALGPWQRVLELIPDQALAARNLGSTLFHLDRFEESIDFYRRSLATQISAPTYRDLGTVLFFLGRYEESEEAFRKCVALTPEDPVNWGNLGNALRLMPGRESGATQALERAVGLMRERLERNPGDAEPRARLAGWLANLGRQEEAAEAICEALRRGPEDVHTMVRAGHVYFQLGDRKEALKWFGAALERGYGPQGLVLSPEIAPLRQDPEFQKLLSGRPGRAGGHESGPSGPEETR